MKLVDLDHTDLLQNTQLDLKSVKILFDSECYGNCAYFLQQSLEKHIKAYLLKNGVFDNLKDLGHILYIAIFEKFVNLFRFSGIENTPLNFKEIVDLFENYNNILKRAVKEKPLKIILWKQSLKIPLSNNEKLLYDGLNKKTTLDAEKINSELPNYSKKYNEYVGLNNLNELILSDLDDKTKTFVKYVQKTSDGLNSEKNLKLSVDDINKLIQTTGYGTGPNALTKEVTHNIKSYTALMKSLEWLNLAIKLFPHETFGRYPKNIDGKITDGLYGEYKNNLQDLITETNDVCTNIHKITF